MPELAVGDGAWDGGALTPGDHQPRLDDTHVPEELLQAELERRRRAREERPLGFTE